MSVTHIIKPKQSSLKTSDSLKFCNSLLLWVGQLTIGVFV